MGHIDFGELKVKLLTSIVAIWVIHVLDISRTSVRPVITKPAWGVGILLAFVLSALLGDHEPHFSGRAPVNRFRRGLSYAAALAGVLITAVRVEFAIAQTANTNAGLEGGQDGLFDAILATPNQKTPVPQDNLLATAPGVEQAAGTPQFTLNARALVLFNSNAQFLSSGGSKTLEGSPLCSPRLGEPAVRYADQGLCRGELGDREVCQRPRRWHRLHPSFRKGAIYQSRK